MENIHIRFNSSDDDDDFDSCDSANFDKIEKEMKQQQKPLSENNLMK